MTQALMDLKEKVAEYKKVQKHEDFKNLYTSLQLLFKGKCTSFPLVAGQRDHLYSEAENIALILVKTDKLKKRMYSTMMKHSNLFDVIHSYDSKTDAYIIVARLKSIIRRTLKCQA